MKLPHIHEFYDRHGKVRRYFRRRGYKQVALPGPPGSEQFMAAYAAAIAGEPVLPAAQRAKAGTMGALVLDYYKSAAFKNLGPKSKESYRRVLENWAAKNGALLATALTRQKAGELIGQVAERTPGQANVMIAVLSKLMSHAIKTNVRSDNPFAGIERYKLGTHHTWTDAELSAFEARWPIGTRERLIYDLLLYTGQRIGDVSKLTRANIVGGRVVIKQQKASDEEPPLSIPIHPQLEMSLRAMPARGLALIARKSGRPMTAGRVYEVMSEAVAKAGLPDRCVPHGLRKALMRRLAESGATDRELMAVSGHKTNEMVTLYTRAAEQARLSSNAIARLSDTGTGGEQNGGKPSESLPPDDG